MAGQHTARRSTSPRRDYISRNKAAYEAGKVAHADGRIHAAALLTYDHLVKRCGAGHWTDDTYPELAAARGYPHGRTIQEHVAQLCAAGLVATADNGRRKIVLALVEDVAAPDATALLEAAARASSVGNIEQARALSYQAAMVLGGSSDHGRDHGSPALEPTPGDVADTPQAVFFAPAGHDPNIMGSRSLDHALPLRDPKDPIGEANASGLAAGDHPASPARFFRREEAPNATVAELRKHGVAAPSVLIELACRSVAEVRSVAARLDRREGVGNWTPDLFVHCIRHGVWGRAAPAQAAQDKVYTSSYGWDDYPTTNDEPPIDDGPPGDPPDGDPPDGLVALWERVLARVQVQVSPDEYTTWLKCTRLLDLHDRRAVVGTPNVFVRDYVDTHFIGYVDEALADELEHYLDAIMFVIGTE